MLQAGCPQPDQHQGAQPGLKPPFIQNQEIPEVFQSLSSPPHHQIPAGKQEPAPTVPGLEGVVFLEQWGPPSPLIYLIYPILLFNTVLVLYLLTRLLPILISIPRELMKGGFSPTLFPTPLCASWGGREALGGVAKVSGLGAGH